MANEKDIENKNLEFEMFKADFAGTYEEHINAINDFSGNRFKILLTLESVPILVVGAMLAAKPKLEGLFTYPEQVYYVIIGSTILSIVVLEWWIGSALHANFFARSLNHLRGKYVQMLKKKPGFEHWEPFISSTPLHPDLGKSHYLKLLVSAFVLINAMYVSLAFVGVMKYKLLLFLMVPLAYLVAHLWWFFKQLKNDQQRAEKRYKECEDPSTLSSNETENKQH